MSSTAGGVRQRTLLTPPPMTPFGGWNWWLPARLARAQLVAPPPAVASMEETR